MTTFISMISEVSTATLSNIATAIGMPVAILVFWRSVKKEREDREYGTYDDLDKCYREFLLICIDRLALGVYGADPSFDERGMTAFQQQQREILLLNLISILERAYIMHIKRSAPMRRQWCGWNSYIDDYCWAPSFARAWRDGLGIDFERGFVKFIDAKMKLIWPEYPKGPIESGGQMQPNVGES